MVARPIYLDASAIVKLVVTEPETAALRRFVAGDVLRLTSRVATVEVRRAIARGGRPGDADRADAVLAGLQVIELGPEIADRAAALEPATIRSLDAIHLASALGLGPELDAFVAYDRRLADAARAAGLAVAAPGRARG